MLRPREADGPRPDALGAAVLACGGARDPLTRGDIDHHPAAGPFATGTAVLSMTRQIGTVLGVAILIAIFGTSTDGVSLNTVRHGWVLILVTAVLSAGTALAIGHRPPAAVPEAAATGARS